MGYDLSKTNEENLLEQDIPLGMGDYDAPYPSDETISLVRANQERVAAEEKSKTYPNYCKYPDKTFSYPDACGAILDDGIPILKGSVGTAKEKAEIKNFCVYGMPSTNPGGMASLILPKDTECIFLNEASLQSTIKRMSTKYTEYYKTVQDVELLAENLVQILPINSVSHFILEGITYVAVIELSDDPGGGAKGHFVDSSWNLWYFKGYYPKIGDKYGEPFQYLKCTDTRTTRQKVIDDYGWLIQWGGVIATIIAGAFTGGGAWVLTAEILAEMGIASFIAYRDWEKGNNVDMAVSILTGLAPWMKTFKQFRGISKSSWKEISDKLVDTKFNKFANPDDYVKFYDELSPDAKKAWNAIARQEDISRDFITKQIGDEFAQDGSKIFWRQANDFFKTNPDNILKIDFVKRLWARELGLNLLITGLGVITGMIWGEELDAKNKEELNNLALDIPENAQLEILQNLIVINDVEKAKRILDRMLIVLRNNANNNPGLKEIQDDIKKWKIQNAQIKKIFKEEGLVYIEISEDGIDTTETEKSPETLTQEGYVKLPYDHDPESYPEDQLIQSDGWYWLKKENIKSQPWDENKTEEKVNGTSGSSDNIISTSGSSDNIISTSGSSDNTIIKPKTLKNKGLIPPKYFE